MEARDPITESEGSSGSSGAKSGSGSGREEREKPPGVKKEEDSFTTADRGGNPGLVRADGRPRRWPIRSEAEPGAGGDVDSPSSSPGMNQPSARLGLAKDRPRLRNRDATGLKRAMPLWP